MFQTHTLGLLCALFQILGIFKSYCFCTQPEFYTAAVLEHARFGDSSIHSPFEMLEKNLDIYKEAVETASKNGVDIIVFPEYGLIPPDIANRSATLLLAEDIPDPKLVTCNPCDDGNMFVEHRILRTLSCLAQNNNIYIVANMVDVKVCQTSKNADPSRNATEHQVLFKACRSDGVKLFNTNIVFNRNGTLVSKYYKQHLYYEPDKDIPDSPENAYFETEFGLFTTFVCFDICFKEAVNAVEERTTKNVAFPTYWIDFFPSGTALQYHQAWAITNKVNLLSANIHFPGTGTIGSGIYSGAKGALIYTFDPYSQTKLLISEVPSDPQDQELLSRDFANKVFDLQNEKFVEATTQNTSDVIPDYCSMKVVGFYKDITTDYRCHELSLMQNGAVLKKLENPSDNLQVCSNNLCCVLKYNASVIADDYYFAVSSSMMQFAGHNLCFQSCFLIRCNDFFDEPCGVYPLSSTTKFQSVELEGNFTTEYSYPSVIKSGMKLVPTNKWNYSNGQITYEADMFEREELLTVSLLSRCYDQD